VLDHEIPADPKFFWGEGERGGRRDGGHTRQQTLVRRKASDTANCISGFRGLRPPTPPGLRPWTPLDFQTPSAHPDFSAWLRHCSWPRSFLAHSIGMSLCNREASVVRLSVRLSVCKLLHASRYFYHKHDSIATKLAHDGPHMGLHPKCAQGQGQGQRSRDTDTFLITRKSLLLPQT